MIKERNYLEILYNDFCSIIAAVMQADGKVYKEELSKLAEKYKWILIILCINSRFVEILTVRRRKYDEYKTYRQYSSRYCHRRSSKLGTDRILPI